MTESIKIVVPTDFSEQSLSVLDWVKMLNEKGHAEVHCVNVVQEPMVYMPEMAGTAAATLPTMSQLEAISKESLDSFISKHMDDFETPPVAKVLVGRPADEIIDYAKKIDAKMIVIATSGHGLLTRAVLGSTAEGVVRLAECPVLTVRG